MSKGSLKDLYAKQKVHQRKAAIHAQDLLAIIDAPKNPHATDFIKDHAVIVALRSMTTMLAEENLQIQSTNVELFRIIAEMDSELQNMKMKMSQMSGQIAKLTEEKITLPVHTETTTVTITHTKTYYHYDPARPYRTDTGRIKWNSAPYGWDAKRILFNEFAYAQDKEGIDLNNKDVHRDRWLSMMAHASKYAGASYKDLLDEFMSTYTPKAQEA